MSRNEDIHNAIWDDPDFESLSADATLLYLWSWTNPRCDMAGIYKVSHQGMTQCKVPLERIANTLAELADANFAFYEEQVLWVRSRVRRLGSKSPNMAKSVVKDLKRIRPDHPLIVRFMDEYRFDRWLKDDLSEAYREGIGNPSEKPVDTEDSVTLPVPFAKGLLKGKGIGIGSEDGGSGGKVELPAGFPDELKPHLRAAYRILRDLAVRRGARDVAVVSLANTVAARTRKPIVRAAYDCAAHWDAKASGPRDVVAAYRNWLDRTDDLARLEPLDDNGRPSSDTPRTGRIETADERVTRFEATRAAA